MQGPPLFDSQPSDVTGKDLFFQAQDIRSLAENNVGSLQST